MGVVVAFIMVSVSFGVQAKTGVYPGSIECGAEGENAQCTFSGTVSVAAVHMWSAYGQKAIQAKDNGKKFTTRVPAGYYFNITFPCKGGGTCWDLITPSGSQGVAKQFIKAPSHTTLNNKRKGVSPLCIEGIVEGGCSWIPKNFLKRR